MEPHDAPSAVELTLAVRDWLERDVADQLQGHLRFHAKVAINTLDIVARELQLGPAQARAHHDRLANAGVTSDAELAAAIRGGRFDNDLLALVPMLEESARDKLLVANPKYLDGSYNGPADPHGGAGR